MKKSDQVIDYFKETVSDEPLVLVYDEHTQDYRIDYDQSDCYYTITYEGKPCLKVRYEDCEALRRRRVFPSGERKDIEDSSGRVVIRSERAFGWLLCHSSLVEKRITATNRLLSDINNGVKASSTPYSAMRSNATNFNGWEEYLLWLFGKDAEGFKFEVVDTSVLPKYEKVKGYVEKVNRAAERNRRAFYRR